MGLKSYREAWDKRAWKADTSYMVRGERWGLGERADRGKCGRETWGEGGCGQAVKRG